jgi:hypothetical protein
VSLPTPTVCAAAGCYDRGERSTTRGDPNKEANVWLDKIAEAHRQRARAQDLAIEGLLSPDELRDKVAALEEIRRLLRAS